MKKYLFCFGLLLLISCKRKSFEPQDAPSPLDAQNMTPYQTIVPEFVMDSMFMNRMDSILFNKMKEYELIKNTEDSCARFIIFRFTTKFYDEIELECVMWELPPRYAIGVWEHKGYYCFLEGNVPHEEKYVIKGLRSVHSMPLYAYIDEPYVYLEIKYNIRKGKLQVVDSNRFYPPLLKDFTENEK